MARGRAPAKLILCGEHAVVYGHLAVAAAVGLHVEVEIVARAGPSGLEGARPDPRLAAALAALLPPEGLGVRVRSEVPVGRGMGSSAALSVALVRALARREGREAGVEECIERAFAAERAFHGTPSGIDHATVAMGGVVAFRRGAPPERLAATALPLVVLDSGRPGETRAMVERVRARRPAVDALLARAGAIAEAAAELLRAEAPDLDALGGLLDENHAVLREIGVSTPELDALVDLARGAGALGAKLSGAGGGGVVLALAPESEPVLRAAAARGVAALRAPLVPPGGGA